MMTCLFEWTRDDLRKSNPWIDGVRHLDGLKDRELRYVAMVADDFFLLGNIANIQERAKAAAQEYPVDQEDRRIKDAIKWYRHKRGFNEAARGLEMLQNIYDTMYSKVQSCKRARDLDPREMDFLLKINKDKHIPTLLAQIKEIKATYGNPVAEEFLPKEAKTSKPASQQIAVEDHDFSDLPPVISNDYHEQ